MTKKLCYAMLTKAEKATFDELYIEHIRANDIRARPKTMREEMRGATLSNPTPGVFNEVVKSTFELIFHQGRNCRRDLHRFLEKVKVSHGCSDINYDTFPYRTEY